MEWTNIIPEKDGRYIVKTKSNHQFSYLFTEHVMYADLHTNEKYQKIWSFKNQIFLAYLK